MCGITGVYLKNPAIVDTENDRIQFDRFIDELLLGIEERGRDATGFVAVRDTHVQLDKKAIPADSFIKTRKRSWLDGGTRMVLGHTRFATQGHQSHFENNHPVMYGSTFVTHNGHIHNDDAVYEQLELDRYAEVDSSAIAASLHWHGFAKAKDALEMLGGGFAIAAIDPVNQPGTLLPRKGGAVSAGLPGDEAHLRVGLDLARHPGRLEEGARHPSGATQGEVPERRGHALDQGRPGGAEVLRLHPEAQVHVVHVVL